MYIDKEFVMFVKSIFAGVFISIGCIAYLNNQNIIGAFVFSVGLLLVLLHSSKLCTGMFGFIENKPLDVIFALIGNVLGTMIVGMIYKENKVISETALTVMQNKFSHSYLYIFLSAVLCGVLIYSAVIAYKVHKNVIMTIMFVATFIAMGADHCIANSFYIIVSNNLQDLYLLKFFLCVVGNAVGSYGLYFYNKLKQWSV